MVQTCKTCLYCPWIVFKLLFLSTILILLLSLDGLHEISGLPLSIASDIFTLSLCSVKQMMGDAPHTQLDAEIAAGMGMPDNGPKLMSM